MNKQQSLEGSEFINFPAHEKDVKLIKTEVTDVNEELSVCNLEMENVENTLVDGIKHEDIFVDHTNSKLEESLPIKTEFKSENMEERPKFDFIKHESSDLLETPESFVTTLKYDIKSEEMKEILCPPLYLEEDGDIKGSNIPDTALTVEQMELQRSCDSKSKEVEEQWPKIEVNQLTVGDSNVMRQGKNISFNCFHCDYSTNFRRNLVSHMLVHGKSKKKLFPCMNCEYSSNYKHVLARHTIRRHSGNYRKHYCKGCEKHFKNEMSLDDHIIKHHQDLIESVSRKVHSCMTCDYKTTRKDNLKRHMAKVHSGNYEKHLCRGCEKYFKDKRSLDDHVIKNHHYLIYSVSSKVLSCSKCNYKTTKRDHLNQHTTYAHSEDYGRHSCRGCEKYYDNKRSLDNHILKSHQNFIDLVSSEVHSCPKCDYKTTRKSNFRQHMNVHAGNCEKYLCKGCEKPFKNKQSLDDHIIKNHNDFVNSISSKVHSCTGCNYKTTKKDRLRQHMKVHSITYD